MNYGRHLFQISLISEAKDSVRINRPNNSFNCLKVSKLKQPTKLFVETVNLYRNNRELYEEVLKEAENVVEPKSVQDEFCSLTPPQNLCFMPKMAQYIRIKYTLSSFQNQL